METGTICASRALPAPRATGAQYRCFYCDADLVRTKGEHLSQSYTRDHIIPRWAVRRMAWFFPESWHQLNAVPSCAACNEAKANISPLDWLDRLPTEESRDRLRERLRALGFPYRGAALTIHSH